jgi:protein-S-isoprenylcysteine O-methyltransferase Ste14
MVRYLAASTFNRQILLEEQSLKGIYGEEYMEYCKKVRRFL